MKYSDAYFKGEISSSVFSLLVIIVSILDMNNIKDDVKDDVLEKLVSKKRLDEKQEKEIKKELCKIYGKNQQNVSAQDKVDILNNIDKILETS